MALKKSLTMRFKKFLLLAVCLVHMANSYSYEKNFPDEPLVIDHEGDINNVVHLTSLPLLLKPPLPREKQWWNFSNKGKEIYRQVAISYMGIRGGNEPLSISAVKIMPGDPAFPSLYSKDDCQYFSLVALSTFSKNSSWEFSHATRLWKDLSEGIIGFQNSKNIITFVRIVCLPMNVIDDIDMVGIEYAYATNPKIEDAEQLISGRALYVSIDDPRLNFRYDPKRFFERFEAYGVTPKFKVPDTKDREGWEKSDWNTAIRIFPLGDAVDLTASRKQ